MTTACIGEHQSQLRHRTYYEYLSHPDKFITAWFSHLLITSLVITHSLPVVQICPYILMHQIIYKCYLLGRLPSRSKLAREYRLPRRQETFKSQHGLKKKPWDDPLQRLSFLRGGGRFSATNEWTFLRSLLPHAATHTVVILPEQIQGQVHKHNR